MEFRVRAFRNILLQDAAYFDSPQHAPGKLITRLATDAPNVKAVRIMRCPFIFITSAVITVSLKACP